MVKSFYARSQLRVALARVEPKNSRLLEQALEVFDKCFPSTKIGTIAVDSLSLSCHTHTIGEGKEAQLDEAVYNCFRSIMPYSSRRVMEYTKCVVKGKEFSVFSSRAHRNSRVFYSCSDKNELIPAVVRSIFVPIGTGSGFYIAVHRHQKKEHHSILAEFPQFGASIWSQQLKDDVEVLASADLTLYGAFSRPWNSNNLIMKAAKEVVSYLSFFVIFTNSFYRSYDDLLRNWSIIAPAYTL